MSEVILEMKHITKAFSGVKALDDVNLQVKKGEIHALCGENGAGKSTLMNVLSGVYPYGSYEGDIIYKGETCKFHKIKDSENKGIVIIHQELALSPYLSIAENVFMGNERVSMKGVMLELKKKGVTCIIISHKLNEISYVADAITIIRDGKTIETLKKGVDEWTEDRIIKGMVGREMNNRYPVRDNCPIGDVVLEVKNWNAYHPEIAEMQILKNINIKVRAGEVVGLAGLMGAGRTEFAMSLFGHSYGQKISGEVYMHGKKVSTKTVKDAINNKIAYTSEDRKTYGLVLINDIKTNMTMAALRNYYSNGVVVDERKENIEAEEYKKKINVKATSIHQTVGALSGGNQQKVVLAKWMMTQPDVLILDEPTRGIDVGAKYEIYCAINDMARAGKAVIVISSEMQEIIGTCDRAYIINEGRIAGELSHEELSQESIMKCIMDSNAKGEE